MFIGGINTILVSVMSVCLLMNVGIMLREPSSWTFILQNVFMAVWVSIELYDACTDFSKFTSVTRCKWKVVEAMAMVFATACIVLEGINRGDNFCIVCGSIGGVFAAKLLVNERIRLRVVRMLETIYRRSLEQQQREEDDHGVQK